MQAGPLMTPAEIEARVRELGAWFQNMDLAGVQTAPNHFLGDYPRIKWQRFAHVIPDDLRGKSVLDVGCNAGFYGIEMGKRGATRVVGIDTDDVYLAQARFAARVNGVDLELHNMSVYDVWRLCERFDFVIFMGVLHNLRHPMLALDLLRQHVVGDMLLLACAQDMLRPAGFEILASPDEDVYLCRATR